MTPEDYRAVDVASAEEGERLARPLTHRLQVIRMLEMEHRFNQSLRFMTPAGSNRDMVIMSSVGGM
jgi:hypothetical protein